MSIEETDQEVPAADRAFVAPDSVESGSEWLDAHREGAYQAMTTEITELAAQEEENAGPLLGRVLQKASSPAFNYEVMYQRTLSAEDHAHISLQRVSPKLASEISGQPIERIAFVVDDAGVYQKLEKVFGQIPGQGHGFNLPGLVFTDRPEWHQASLLISRANQETIDHEIQHSIDPNPDRQGYDRMIEEMFAYASNARGEKGIDWQALANLTVQKPYYAKYSATLKEADRISFEDWRGRVGLATAALRDMAGWQGDIQALQKLGKMGSVDELLIEWQRLRTEVESKGALPS